MNTINTYICIKTHNIDKQISPGNTAMYNFRLIYLT